ncbi:two-component sensor histidine kinase [Sphaerisporangium melleum]|uniref:histidine kinase n=1 Tax=Sphaerisporangium melleum TaxID=321316 RepID=A0A917VFD1_9ACTN|nr:sensor histidine kinase [Sphaerisporangium melleum]GGK70147.1 two-component sensor histidine kinase [Sphaerisporangium melleum]GII70318.1 two-component sensor histidine kinase [Sphaerisporangium melleum]
MNRGAGATGQGPQDAPAALPGPTTPTTARHRPGESRDTSRRGDGLRALSGPAPPATTRGAVILVTGLALTGFDAWLASRWGAYGSLFYVKELVQVVVWLLAGALVARLRPATAMGMLMMLLGLLLAADAPAAFALEDTPPPLRVLVTAGLLLTALQLPLGAHVFLAYPSGVVRDRAGRAVMRAGYAFGAVWAFILLVVGPPPARGRCVDVCDPLALIDNPTLQMAGAKGLAIGTALLVTVGGAVIVRRYALAGRRERRTLAFPAVAMVATALLWAAVNTQAAMSPLVGQDILGPTLALAQFAALVAVPASFFMGLLRERLDEARVSDLARHIAELPAERLCAALATALGDPHLTLAFPLADGHSDAEGRPLDLARARRGRAVTAVGDTRAPIALLVHDPSLSRQPALVEAVSAVAHLALENARLQAAVRAQLAQVRASRARLVSAGDQARRRLERDLHDGAQQRMLSAGLALRLLRLDLAARAPAAETMKLLDEAEEELRTAGAELRELARGIHPAILTVQGLGAALRQLVLRGKAPVHLDLDDLPRLRPEIEATAYFVVGEALTNAVRHAAASRIDVRARVRDGRLIVTVADDGAGGASALPGSGLAGLADRVAAVDGTLTLHSPPGQGTELTVDLPCA